MRYTLTIPIRYERLCERRTVAIFMITEVDVSFQHLFYYIPIHCTQKYRYNRHIPSFSNANLRQRHADQYPHAVSYRTNTDLHEEACYCWYSLPFTTNYAQTDSKPIQIHTGQPCLSLPTQIGSMPALIRTKAMYCYGPDHDLPCPVLLYCGRCTRLHNPFLEGKS